MVVSIEDAAATDRLFRALSDATRRDIVLSTLREGQSVTTLAQRYDMSFAAVQKHVAVLESALLVTKQRRGREQVVTGNVETLRRAGELLDVFEQAWRGRADRISGILSEGSNE
jgi:DNA-binding transcriptional ArsR family regulator